MAGESFWAENDTTTKEEVQTNLNDDLLLIPKKISELVTQVEQAKEQLDYLEILRARQHQQLMNLQEEYVNFADSNHAEYEKIKKQIGKSLIEVTSEHDGILKITLDFLLPIYPKTKSTKLEYYTVLHEIYRERLVSLLLQNRNKLPNFENSDKVFVLIVQYFNNNNRTDLDNRFHSFIFNALRSARMTPDDSWQKLSYMEDGRKTEGKAYTEILVGNYDDLFSIIQSSRIG